MKNNEERMLGDSEEIVTIDHQRQYDHAAEAVILCALRGLQLLLQSAVVPSWLVRYIPVLRDGEIVLTV